MVIGASTSNLYPMLTEDSLDMLLKLGFRELEVFINTESEAALPFARMIRQHADRFGARIRSLHPYISGTEPYLLFSTYDRRYQDGLNIYSHIFEAAAEMGAEIVVMHGDRAGGVLSVEDSISRFESLYNLGQTFGMVLAQENVVRFRSSDNDYLRAMRQQLGKNAHFVLDVKQCKRCGHSLDSVIEAMGTSIAHVHISDHDTEHDCLLPGTGKIDYPHMFQQLHQVNFQGAMMLELYRSNFASPEDLVVGWEYLKNIDVSK